VANTLEILIQAKDQASKELEGVTKSTEKMSKQLRGMGVAMVAVGVAITAALTAMTVQWAKAGDEVAKLAAKTGFTTEMLSELRHAANLSGSSLAGLETGIKRMARTIIDARDGLSTAVRSLEDLGLSYEELKDLSPEEQFMTMTKAMANIEDPTLRAAVAMSVFGRAGTDMLPMLANGEEGLEAMRQEAHDLGLVFSADAAKAAEAFNDSITKLKGAFAGIGAQIAKTLAPIITGLIETITKVIKKIIDWTDRHPALRRAITIITGAVGLLSLAFGSLILLLPVLTKLAPFVGMAFHTMLGPIGLVTLAISGLVAAIGFLATRTSDTDKLKGKIKELGDAIISELSPALKQAATDATEMATDAKGAIQGVIDYIKGIEAAGMELIPEDVLDKIKEIRPDLYADLVVIQNGIRDTHAAYQLLTDDITKTRIAEIQLELEKPELTDAEKATLLSELGTLLSGEAKRLLEKNAPDLVGILEQQQTDIDTALATQLASWETHWADIEKGWDGTVDYLENEIIPALNNAIENGIVTPDFAQDMIDQYNDLATAMKRAQKAAEDWEKHATLQIPGLTPRIPYPKFAGDYQHGGIVPGPIGQPVPIIAHGGEQFLGNAHMPVGNVVNVNLGLLPGDDVTMRRLSRLFKQFQDEDSRRNAFGPVNKGFYYGRSSI